MTNLYQAAEDCASEAATPSSPPKTPQTTPFDKAHNSEWGENFGGPATSETKDNHARYDRIKSYSTAFAADVLYAQCFLRQPEGSDAGSYRWHRS